MNRDYYVFKNGRLRRKDNTLYFEPSNGRRIVLPIEGIERLHIFGEVDMNAKLLNFLSQHGVVLNLYNHYGFYTGSFLPRKKNVSGYLLVKQAEHFIDRNSRMYIASAFVEGAVFHMKRNLRNREETSDILESILEEENNIMKANNVRELMGIEGSIRKLYYSAFSILTGNRFSFKNREKRPPNDPINALISFGNSLMYSAVLGEIYKTQLDPTISYLHEPSTKRFSLSLDIAEIFKPLVIDPVIFKLVNNRMITEKSFDFKEGVCLLNNDGRKIFIKAFEDKLSTTIKHRRLKRKVSYRGFIRLECYKLIKHLIGDEIYNPLKAWW